MFTSLTSPKNFSELYHAQSTKIPNVPIYTNVLPNENLISDMWNSIADNDEGTSHNIKYVDFINLILVAFMEGRFLLNPLILNLLITIMVFQKFCEQRKK